MNTEQQLATQLIDSGVPPRLIEPMLKNRYTHEEHNIFDACSIPKGFSEKDFPEQLKELFGDNMSKGPGSILVEALEIECLTNIHVRRMVILSAMKTVMSIILGHTISSSSASATPMSDGETTIFKSPPLTKEQMLDLLKEIKNKIKGHGDNSEQ